jgi:hypothetical protein
VWHAVDCIEETKEADGAHWTAEGFSEGAHEFEESLLLSLLV